MPFAISIEPQGVQELQNYLSVKAGNLRGVAVSGLFAASQIALRELQRYPPHPAPRPQWVNGFVSERQRRYFFWALKTGAIRVPYPRTFAQRDGWKAEQTAAGAVSRITVYNNVASIRWTQDRDTQTRFHAKSGWATVQDVQERLSERMANKAIDVILDDLGKG